MARRRDNSITLSRSESCDLPRLATCAALNTKSASKRQNPNLGILGVKGSRAKGSARKAIRNKRFYWQNKKSEEYNADESSAIVVFRYNNNAVHVRHHKIAVVYLEVLEQIARSLKYSVK